MCPYKECFGTYKECDASIVFMGNDSSSKVIEIGPIKVRMFDGVVKALIFCLLCNQINLGDTLIVFDDLSSHIQKCKAVADVYIVAHLVFCLQAAYTVGGHSFSAAAIEYVILKMKPPVHRPQIALLLALHKLKVSEELRKSGIDACEPLVAFAFSCGMYSSPAIRIYTAKKVREELQEAQRDFIGASVGLSSKGRLLVPKMLHCFAKGFVDDAKLALPSPHQAAFVEQCISQRRQSLLCSRNCGILPFDSHFCYLFLPGQLSL
ncbi:uncharacterized protein LOC100253078 [Vitis vinifera]|uniref:uncharacterized protein LOC100253078 n=1 Tax=Vitis vinifera TaxID=29760 RepID=UPI002882D58A|nr:uncharacterized protein LOC100253078 [Vitis vinifera]